MRFIEVPALITEDIEDPDIVYIRDDILASIDGTTLTIDGDSKVSGEVTITLTGDVNINAVSTSNLRTPSIHKITIKTNGAGNFTYVPNAGVTASSVSTTTKTGSDLEILLITTSGGDTYLDLDVADYVSPAANFSNVLTGFNVSELTSTYGATAKLYKPDGTLLTTVSAATGSGIGFGSGVESSPGDVEYKLEVTDDLGRKSTYNLPRKWINYAMGTTSTPGFQKFRLEGIDDDYTATVMFPSLGSSSTAKVYRTSDHGYLGINFKIQGRDDPSGAWTDIANADEDDDVLAFGDFLYHRVWVKPTAKATTTVSSSNVVTLTLTDFTEENVTTSFDNFDPYDINESTNTYVFEETTKIGTVPFTVTLGSETYTNAVSATTEGTAYDYVTLAFANPTLSLTTSNVTISSAKLYRDDVLFHTYGTESNVVLRSDQTGTYQAVVNDVYYSNRVVPDFTTTRSVSAPQLEFDGYNRLNLSNITPTSTTLGLPDGTTRDLTTQSNVYIYKSGTYTANVQTSETFAYLSNVVTSQPSQNPTDVGPTFTFDEYNRLAISNLTQTSSTLKYGSNTYDTNTASNVYVTDAGEYILEAKDANTFVMSNVYVGGVSQHPSDVVPTLTFDGYNKLTIDNVRTPTSSGGQIPISGSNWSDRMYVLVPSLNTIDRRFYRLSDPTDLSVLHGAGGSGLVIIYETDGTYTVGVNETTPSDGTYDSQYHPHWIAKSDITSQVTSPTSHGSVTNVTSSDTLHGGYYNEGQNTPYKRFELSIPSSELQFGSLPDDTVETATIKKDGAAFATTTSNTVYIRDTGTYTAEVKGSGAYAIELSKEVTGTISQHPTDVVPSLTYDNYNKITLNQLNYEDTTTVSDPNGSTYNIGTAKTMYVKDAGEYVFKISGTDKYVESNVYVSSVDLAGAPTKPIDFDGYNKLTLIDAGSNVSANVTYFSNTYELGSANVLYINGAGTYGLEMSGSNVFALSSNVVGTVSQHPTDVVPSLTFDGYNKLTLENFTTTESDTRTAKLTDPNDVEYTLGQTQNDIYIEETGDYFLEVTNSDQSAVVKTNVGTVSTPSTVTPTYGGTQELVSPFHSGGLSTTVTSSNLTGAYTPNPPTDSGVQTQLASSSVNSYDLQNCVAWNNTQNTDDTKIFFTFPYWTKIDKWEIWDARRDWTFTEYHVWFGSSTTDLTKYATYSFSPTNVWNDATPNNQTQTLSSGSEQACKVMAFSFTDPTTNPNNNDSTIAGPGVARIKIWGYQSATSTSSLVPTLPKLDFDGYNKLSIENLTPTSTSLRLGSNTYDIGTASNVYIEDAGTYKMATGDATTFALVSNVVGVVDTTTFTLAFHHGTFNASDYSSAYSSITAAATAGFVYSDTATGTYTWGTLNSVDTSTTGQTGYSWSPSDTITADVLMVAGGGGGGGANGGGGGAGGLVYNSGISLSGAKTIVVGTGGAKGINWNTTGTNATKGNNTSFTDLDTAIGGGAGSTYLNNPDIGSNDNGGSGGGGGGSSYTSSYVDGGTGTSGQGNGGGRGIRYAGGGGGGAGGSGSDGSSPQTGGAGGTGLNYTTTFGTTYGDSGWFAGGGGGGQGGGQGGQGGGGDGGMPNTEPGYNGQSHTGGGGGGGNVTGGDGGSGIVLIKKLGPINPPTLNFDTSNKLSIANLTPTSTTLTDPNGSSFDIGTASNVYIRDSGKYSITSKDANTFVLASNTVTGTPTGTTYVYDSNTFTTPSQTYDTTKTITVSNVPSTQTGITGKIYKGSTAYPIHTTTSSSNVIIKNTGTYVSVFTTATQAFLTNAIGVTTQPTTTSDDTTIEDAAPIVTTTVVGEPLTYKAYLKTGINVNASTSWTAYDIFGSGYSEEINQGGFTLANSNLVAPETGYYRLSFNIYLSGTGTSGRQYVGVKPIVEGTDLNEISASNYIRIDSGHTEASTSMSTVIHLTGNKEVNLKFARLTDITSSSVIISGSFITLEKVKISTLYKAYLKTGINVNASTSWTAYDIFGSGYSEEINQGGFTLANSNLVAPETGYYRLSFNVYVYSTGERTNVGVKPTVEGTDLNEISASDYIRSASVGDNESSTNMSTIIYLTGNKEVNLKFARLTDTTTSVTIQSGSFITLEKI
jgi:hypothetical protein